jgi:7-keto-8-aminopelargonate synthetase-like enzyme
VWRARLDAIRAAGLERTLRVVRPTGPTTAELDGQPVIVACSNDYLGLAWDPDVRAAASGGGSGGSRLIGGSRPIHDALESALEELYGRPALLFPSGWQANLAVFSTACVAGERMASDALNHASIIDGMRLSRAERVIVPHADASAIPDDIALVAVEGLFSMDGDVPPLADYPRGPLLAVDEAHSVGCLGPRGLGAAAAAGIVPDVVIGTFGKALGSAGAFVVGPPELRELLVNTGRSFIFTTAAPEPVVAMALAGLRRATGDAELRERLAAQTARLRAGFSQQGWRPLGDAHIVPVVVGPRAMELAAALLAKGVLAPGIRAPTVPAGTERVRFTVSAAHTDDQIDRIVDALGPAA